MKFPIPFGVGSWGWGQGFFRTPGLQSLINMLNKEKGQTRDHKDQRKTTLQPAGIVKRLPKKGLITIG